MSKQTNKKRTGTKTKTKTFSYADAATGYLNKIAEALEDDFISARITSKLVKVRSFDSVKVETRYTARVTFK